MQGEEGVWKWRRHFKMKTRRDAKMEGEEGVWKWRRHGNMKTRETDECRGKREFGNGGDISR